MRTIIYLIVFILGSALATVNVARARREKEEALVAAELIAYGNQPVARYLQNALFDASDPSGIVLRRELGNLNRFVYGPPPNGWGNGIEMELALGIMATYSNITKEGRRRNKRAVEHDEEYDRDLYTPGLHVTMGQPDNSTLELGDDDDDILVIHQTTTPAPSSEAPSSSASPEPSTTSSPPLPSESHEVPPILAFEEEEEPLPSTAPSTKSPSSYKGIPEDNLIYVPLNTPDEKTVKPELSIEIATPSPNDSPAYPLPPDDDLIFVPWGTPLPNPKPSEAPKPPFIFETDLSSPVEATTEPSVEPVPSSVSPDVNRPLPYGNPSPSQAQRPEYTIPVTSFVELILQLAQSKDQELIRIRNDLISWTEDLNNNKKPQDIRQLGLDLLRRGVRPMRQKMKPYMFPNKKYDDI